jgi:hypothetical protein
VVKAGSVEVLLTVCTGTPVICGGLCDWVRVRRLVVAEVPP